MRFGEWWDKLATHAVACALLLYALSSQQAFVFPFAVSFAYSIAYLSFAYSVNSLSDIREDRMAGKRRDGKHVRAIAFLSGLLSLALPFAFLRQDLALLGLLAFLLAAYYSLRPLRFKGNALLGVFVPAIAQRPLPFFLFVLLAGLQSAESAYLFGWLFLVGAYAILAHQLRDYRGDAKTGIGTLAVRVGKHGAESLRNAAFVALMAYSLAAFLLFPSGPLCSAILIGISALGFAKQLIFNPVAQK